MKTTFRAKLYRFAYPFFKIYLYLFRPKSIGACCVIECQSRILLIRNTYGSGLWSFPGGGVKAKELPIAAAIRETSKEVGIALKSVDKIGELLFDANGHHDLIHIFHAVVHDTNFNIDPDEILEAKWFSPNEIQLEKLTAVGLKISETFQRSKIKS